ncbi:hypothetical protein JCM9743_32930 [Natrinema sp. JCM 9743]
MGKRISSNPDRKPARGEPVAHRPTRVGRTTARELEQTSEEYQGHPGEDDKTEEADEDQSRLPSGERFAVEEFVVHRR